MSPVPELLFFSDILLKLITDGLKVTWRRGCPQCQIHKFTNSLQCRMYKWQQESFSIWPKVNLFFVVTCDFKIYFKQVFNCFMCVHAHGTACVENRGQPVEAGAILPPCGTWGQNSDHHFQWQIPLHTVAVWLGMAPTRLMGLSAWP